jgi:hypothetical protein
MALGNEDRRFATELAQERVRRAADYWEGKYYERLRDFDEYYRVKLPAALEQAMANDERSNLVPPDIHVLTNDFRAQIVRPFYRSGKLARMLGRGPSDVRNEPFAQAMFDWCVNVTNRWQEFDKDAHSIATKGFAVTMTELKPIVYRKVDNKGNIVEEPLFGGAMIPHTVHLEALRFYADPSAKSLTWPNCRFVAYSVDMTKESLFTARARDKKHWVFTDQELKDLWAGTRSAAERDDPTKRFEIQAYYDTRVGGNDNLTLDWYVGDFTHPDRPLDFRQAVIGMVGNTLVYFSDDKAPAPLVDFFNMMTINQEDGELFGMGKIAAIEDSYLEVYTKRNQSIDLANLGGYGMTFIQRGSGLPEAHRVGPFTWVETDNPLDARTINPAPNAILLQEMLQSRNELRDAYGSNYSLGINPDQRESATGANILVESQSVQHHAALIQIWNTGLRRECEFRHNLLQMYAPDEIWIRVSEDKLRPMQRVTKDQIVGQFDFTISIGHDEFMPDAVRQARMERVVSMYRGDPDIDQLELKRRHLQVMGLADAELLIVGQDEKEGWARAENATVLQYGVQLPLFGAEDHMVHARIHFMGILSGTEMAKQDLIRAENVEALMQHYELHLVELQATQGIAVDNSQVLPPGNGSTPQPRAELGASTSVQGAAGGRQSLTRANAQNVANERGVFQ